VAGLVTYREKEADAICRDVLALLERLASMSGSSDHLRSAELLTVGPEAKVPYPEVVHTPSGKVA
jgi:hypothetical protein